MSKGVLGSVSSSCEDLVKDRSQECSKAIKKALAEIAMLNR